jgi:hypothetical protein
MPAKIPHKNRDFMECCTQFPLHMCPFTSKIGAIARDFGLLAKYPAGASLRDQSIRGGKGR